MLKEEDRVSLTELSCEIGTILGELDIAINHSDQDKVSEIAERLVVIVEKLFKFKGV
jgi:hypothetical protein